MPISKRTLRPSRGRTAAADADATAYIAAVEAADGVPLESAIRNAVTALVTGLKIDGLWGKLGAACILAGARTLPGALTPLVGAAPTHTTFVAGDYSRRNGLVGTGAARSLNSNRPQNADPQDDLHMAVYVTVAATNAGFFPSYIGVGNGSAGDVHLGVLANGVDLNMRMRSATADTFTGRATATGLVGFSRSQSASYTATAGGVTSSFSRTSQTPRSESTRVLSGLNVSTGNANSFSNGRLSWYSIGRAVDLPALRARLDTFMTAVAAALPLDMDSDAASYIAAVEAADGQPLETSVRQAINSFVSGLKIDGVWGSITNACVFAGARTLAGALVPLKGVAPTNQNFVSGDYARGGSSPGLLGNGTTKAIATNVNLHTLALNDHSAGAWVTNLDGTIDSDVVFGSGTSATGSLLVLLQGPPDVAAPRYSFRSRQDSPATYNYNLPAGETHAGKVGLYGLSRSSSSQYLACGGGWFSPAVAHASFQSTTNWPLFVYRRDASSPLYANLRMSFYWMGTNLSLPALSSRVSTLMSAIGTALP